MDIFVLCGWTDFFFKNPAVLRFLTFWYLTTCKVSEKSLAPFLRSQNPPIRTGTRSSIYIPPLTWRIVIYRDFLKRIRRTVFCICSESICSTFWRFNSKISILFFEKSAKMAEIDDFGPSIANFEVKYLNFLKKFRPAVFCVCLVLLSSTFWRFKTKISILLFEKSAKNLDFYWFFVIFCRLSIFFKNPAVSHFLHFWYLTSCRVSGKSLEPFSLTFDGHLAGHSLALTL